MLPWEPEHLIQLVLPINAHSNMADIEPGTELEAEEKDVEHGSNSDQPNDETQALAIDDKNTAAIGSSSSKKSEDAIEKLDSEVAGNILNEDKTEGVEVVSGDKEEGGGAGMPDDLEVAPDQSEVKDEVQDQDSGAVEASNESEQDQKEDAQVVGENVEPSASGESKTDPTKDKTVEDAQDGEKEINNEQDELEQHKVDDDVTTAVESHNEVDTTNSALENQDKPDIIENIEGGDSNVREGEGHGSAGEVPGDQTLENTVGVSVALEPLEDIIEEEEGEVEEEQGVEPVDREELLAKTKEVLLEQDRLKSLSAQLQHKIAEYFAKKKTEERPDPGRNVTDQEKRYNQCMAALELLEMDLSTLKQRSELQDTHLQVLREDKLTEVKQANDEFANYKKNTAITAVHSRTGKRLQAQEVELFQAAEDKKELELTQVRLENIKLQNKISKLEAGIKEKEQLAEGLHMIDFEQLKINNVDLNEKIEERNEDILKLRKKVTSTVQVLTHVKEKLQFLQAENGDKRAVLRNVDEVVAKKRDHLTRTKQARDALRMDNVKLKQKGGLVAHPALLGDFEERKDQNDELKVHLEELQRRHSELTVICDGLRKKVEQARTIHPRNM